MSSNSNRRRTLGLKVASGAQRYFILLEFILLMSTMVYLLYLIFGTISDVTDKTVISSQMDLVAAFDQINFLLLIRISVLFIVVFVINVLLGLFYLHRLIGPLVRIKSVLHEIAEGRIPSRDVILRKGDFPIDLAHELTLALQAMREMKKEE